MFEMSLNLEYGIDNILSWFSNGLTIEVPIVSNGVTKNCVRSQLFLVSVVNGPRLVEKVAKCNVLLIVPFVSLSTFEDVLDVRKRIEKSPRIRIGGSHVHHFLSNFHLSWASGARKTMYPDIVYCLRLINAITQH